MVLLLDHRLTASAQLAAVDRAVGIALGFLAVAGRALDASLDMRGVYEVDVVRQTMYTLPIDRLLGGPRGADLVGLGISASGNFVAEHALLHIRIASCRGDRRRAMAEAALEPD